MNENKQNTALLTVIAVATLLVAVVGATFAYFTAANSNNSTSQITGTSGKMIIAFADGTAKLSGTLTNEGFQPGTTVLVDKTFTLTGTNTAIASGSVTDNTGLDMPYTVYLTYKNEFTSDEPNAENSEGGLYYHLKGTPTGSATVNYETSTVSTVDASYVSAMIPTTRTPGSSKGENGHYPATESNIKLASGLFKPKASGTDVITFNLKITFPDNGKPQNSNKGATFTGKIEVNKNLNEVTTYANR